MKWPLFVFPLSFFLLFLFVFRPLSFFSSLSVFVCRLKETQGMMQTFANKYCLTEKKCPNKNIIKCWTIKLRFFHWTSRLICAAQYLDYHLYQRCIDSNIYIRTFFRPTNFSCERVSSMNGLHKLNEPWVRCSITETNVLPSF